MAVRMDMAVQTGPGLRDQLWKLNAASETARPECPSPALLWWGWGAEGEKGWAAETHPSWLSDWKTFQP